MFVDVSGFYAFPMVFNRVPCNLVGFRCPGNFMCIAGDVK